jgi:endonuclease/exonuclease/phosphatase family metal-dependent hydrolase
LAGERDRIIISDLVRSKCDSISGNQPGAKILITGDLNCTPEDPVIKRLMRESKDGCVLENLSDSLSSAGTGSYRYSGSWEMIDQVIVSDFLLKDGSGISASRRDLLVFKPDFLLVEDPSYPGLRPFSTYRGYRYQGGFSDHLPIIVELKFK